MRNPDNSQSPGRASTRHEANYYTRSYVNVRAMFFHLLGEYTRLHVEYIAALQELVRLQQEGGR